jgi:hypothetical protein
VRAHVDPAAAGDDRNRPHEPSPRRRDLRGGDGREGRSHRRVPRGIPQPGLRASERSPRHERRRRTPSPDETLQDLGGHPARRPQGEQPGRELRATDPGGHAGCTDDTPEAAGLHDCPDRREQHLRQLVERLEAPRLGPADRAPLCRRAAEREHGGACDRPPCPARQRHLPYDGLLPSARAGRRASEGWLAGSRGSRSAVTRPITPTAASRTIARA